MKTRRQPSNVTFKVFHGESHVQIQIHGDDEYPHSVYLKPEELEPLNVWRKIVMDGNRIVLLEPCRMVLIDTPDRSGSYTGDDGKVNSTAFIYHMDVQRFLNAVRILSQKQLQRTITLDSLRIPAYVPPIYTVQQLVTHRNAREISKTVLQFRRELPDDKWKAFMERASDYIDRAILCGHDREFYFDGRRVPEGSESCLGFNGAFILREASFSIHT